jgi:hypothetical protein
MAVATVARDWTRSAHTRGATLRAQRLAECILRIRHSLFGHIVVRHARLHQMSADPPSWLDSREFRELPARQNRGGALVASAGLLRWTRRFSRQPH